MFINNIFFNGMNRNPLSYDLGPFGGFYPEEEVYTKPGIVTDFQSLLLEYPFIRPLLARRVTELIKYEKEGKEYDFMCCEGEIIKDGKIQSQGFLPFAFEDESDCTIFRKVRHIINVNYDGYRSKQLIQYLFLSNIDASQYMHMRSILQSEFTRQREAFLNTLTEEERETRGDTICFEIKNNESFLEYFRKTFRNGDTVNITDEDLNQLDNNSALNRLKKASCTLI